MPNNAHQEYIEHQILERLNLMILLSPFRRFVKIAVFVIQDCRELAGCKKIWADVFVEYSRFLKRFALSSLRIKNAYRFLEVVANHFHWGCNVRISRNKHGAIISVVEGIKKHVGRNVYIRPFFLGLDDLNHSAFARIAVCAVCFHNMGKVATVDNICIDCPQGSEIHFLPCQLPRITWSRSDKGREVFDADNSMPLGEHLGSHLIQIKPFVSSAFESAVVKVESIYIDHCSHEMTLLEKARAASDDAAPRPFVETNRGFLMAQLYHFAMSNARLESIFPDISRCFEKNRKVVA